MEDLGLDLPIPVAKDDDEQDTSPPTSKTEIQERLRALALKVNAERKANRDHVKDEEQRKKEGIEGARQRRRQEWEEKKKEEERAAEEQGIDIGRKRNLEITVESAEREREKKRAKKKEVHGWSAFNQDASYYAYEKRVKKIKHDPDEYAAKKAATDAEAFFPDANALTIVQEEVSDEAADRMAKEMKSVISKRKTYSRHRAFNEDEDITYINRRNQKFNEKIKRAFDKYTVETKQNLERGTAV